MTAGDKGTLITITVSGLPLTSASVSLVVARANPQSAYASSTSYAMTVISATQATYLTTGTEFPLGGTYSWKITASYSSGADVFSSAFAPLNVNY